jgi:hypothetical protein
MRGLAAACVLAIAAIAGCAAAPPEPEAARRGPDVEIAVRVFERAPREVVEDLGALWTPCGEAARAAFLEAGEVAALERALGAGTGAPAPRRFVAEAGRRIAVPLAGGAARDRVEVAAVPWYEGSYFVLDLGAAVGGRAGACRLTIPRGTSAAVAAGEVLVLVTPRLLAGPASP